MNAAALLAHYERIADAPDAILRLRRLVLDLAVRGKLVQQEKTSEQAILNDQQTVAERSTKRRSEKASELNAVESHELPFPIPATWLPKRLGEVATCLDYMRRPINSTERELRVAGKSTSELFPYYGATQQQGWIDDYIFDEELVLLGEDGVPFFDGLRPKAYLISGKSWVNNHAHVFRGVLASNAFLVHYLNVFDYAGRVVGATRSKLNQARALDIPVMLPPLAEQHRIVAKVDELMALCDRLEAARMQREATRDRLAAASLARLNTPEPPASSDGDASNESSFQADARFAIGTALPALTTRPDQIKQLRRTILNLAFRGVLLPQIPSEGTAADLLSEATKQRPQPAAGRKRQVKAVPSTPVGADEAPYHLPSSWTWARFAEVASIQSNLVDPRDFKAAPHIAPDNIESGTGRLLPYETIGASGVISSKHRFAGGCLLYSKIRPALAKVVAVDFDGLCSADMYPIVPLIDRKYLHKFMLTEAFVRQSVSEDNRVAMPKINQESLAKIAVAVPPLAEQHRIVAKVDELLTLCDQLEVSLTHGENTRSRLLNALLHEALAPPEHKLEAA